MTFTVLIPQSLSGNITAGEAAVVQYGHGLFGDQSEVETEFLTAIANQHKYVFVAVDWWGLSQDDAVDVALMMVSSLFEQTQ